MFVTKGLKFSDTSKYYMCGKTVGHYLIKKGIPLLARENEYMVFKKTKALQEAVDTMPFYIKTLVKAGVVNG